MIKPDMFAKVVASLKANHAPVPYIIHQDIYDRYVALGYDMSGCVPSKTLPPFAELRPTATTDGVRAVLERIKSA